jgi:uncharacterized DUF497 family protein
VKITFDPAKRDATLQARGLDFADARTVFSSRHTTRRDNRREYGEDRFITVGLKGNRLVVVVWTSRGEERRVISMRDANAKEKPFFDRYVR